MRQHLHVSCFCFGLFYFWFFTAYPTINMFHVFCFGLPYYWFFTAYPTIFPLFCELRAVHYTTAYARRKYVRISSNYQIRKVKQDMKFFHCSASCEHECVHCTTAHERDMKHVLLPSRVTGIFSHFLKNSEIFRKLL